MPRKYIRKQKGGVFIQGDYTQESARDFFLENCTMSILSYKSVGGILFKLTLKDGVKSPYALARSNFPLAEVKNLAMKCVFIKSRETNINIEFYKDTNKTGNASVYTANISEFTQEVDTQVDIFKKSLNKYLEPICPSIVDMTMTGMGIDTSIFTTIAGDQSTRSLMEAIIAKDIMLGFIFMECLDGFDTLSTYTQYGVSREDDENADTIELDPEKVDKRRRLQAMATYELWRLYNVGYLHGDPHQGNILFNPNYVYINDSDYKGRAILLDFGRTKKHNNKIPETNWYNTIKRNTFIIDIDWWSYKWIVDIVSIDEALIYIDLIVRINEQREGSKKAFDIHVEGDIEGYIPMLPQPPPNAAGGAVAAAYNAAPELQLATPMQGKPYENTVSTTYEKGSEPQFITSQQEKTVAPVQEVQPETIMPPTINYSVLDPQHIFTVEYVKNVIQNENNYMDTIVANFKKLAINMKPQSGGKRTKHKRKRINKTSRKLKRKN